MTDQIEYLEWDSDFFRLKIGKLIVPNSKDNYFNLSAFRDRIKSSEFDLVYLIIDFSTSKLVSTSELNLAVSDEKTFFLYKENDLNPLPNKPNEKVVSYNRSIHKFYDLENLAIKSGEFSRFKLDNKFPEGSFERLYKRWISNSVEKIDADDVLIYFDSEMILGFLTYKIKENYIYIGLIATDESYRGKGIGSCLMNSLKGLMRKNKLDEIRVVSQLSNSVACNYYKRQGFGIINIQHIYHIWK